MTLRYQTRLLEELEHCLLLAVHVEDAQFTVCLAIAEPDIELVADILPQEYFENGSNVHVAALHTPEDVPAAIEEITFSMEPDDVVVFLCADETTFDTALAQFDSSSDSDATN